MNDGKEPVIQDHTGRASQHLVLSPNVGTDFTFPSNSKTSVARVGRVKRKMIQSEFGEVGRSHIISCFEEFGFLFQVPWEAIGGF